MNRLLGYEPYKDFQIYAFSREGKDFFGRTFEGYRGWAKRLSDGKCFNGTVCPTIKDAEDEMKTLIDILLTAEENHAKGIVNNGVPVAAFIGFK